MIPPDMTSDLHEAFNIIDRESRRLKNIITPMEDTDDDYYHAHANLLLMINDAKKTLDDIVVRAESLTVKPKRP